MFASLRPARRALSAVAAPARRTRRPLPSPLTVTGNAVERVRALISKKPDALGVVLGVRKRGCNGLSYTLNYAETQPDAKCEIVNLEGDLKVFVMPDALFHIVGTVMDYETTELTEGFTFTNPNEKGRCGCGESFNV
mmetsp:Transcript_19254/g.65043  ORF Transcript_19254/g.65043 Transcript_19254/m.65043 type:complete len:137 (-) Transcript_19254:96-506(-)